MVNFSDALVYLFFSQAMLALREVWESLPKIALGLPKINAKKSGTPNF